MARRRGLGWLGPEVCNTQAPTKWRCKKCENEWVLSYTAISQAGSCPGCSPRTRRKTPNDYHELAASRDDIDAWLGPEVPNIKTPTSWRCREGHVWSSTYKSITQQGSGCQHPLCNPLRVPSSAYREKAEEMGYEWLGPEIPNVATKTWWRCGACRHEWSTSYSGLKGCPACSSKARLLDDAYYRKADELGHEWTGGCLPPNAHVRTGWRCKTCKWEWEIAYLYLKGCPKCAGNTPVTPLDCHNIVTEREDIYEWLGPEVPNGRTKTHWRCAQDRDHVWSATYQAVRGGSGCHYCAGNLPKAPADFHELAASRDDIDAWLGPEVPNTKTLTNWRCKRGHVWETPYGTISGGSGCPKCLQSRGELQVAQLLKTLQIPYQRQRRFRKCRGDSNRMLRFDFYFTLHSHRLLVEYDGQQHFFPMDFFGGEEGFEELKRRDEIKNTFAQEYGFDLIRIPYTVSDIGAYLIREIARITGKSYEDIAFRQPQSSIAPTSFEEASAEGFQLPLFYADD